MKGRAAGGRPVTRPAKVSASAPAAGRSYDDSPIGHVTLDRHGVIRELNPKGASLLGAERSSLEKRSLRSLLAAGSRRTFDAHLRASFKSQRPLHVELGVAVADGARRTVDFISSPPSGPTSRDRQVIHSVMIDISERKLDEERRRTLLEHEHERIALAESDRVKREILTIVSHELRTPLAPMRLWVNALRVGGLSDTLRARAVDALDACLKVQVTLIDDLIDVARGHSGKLRVERRPMDLQLVAGAAIEAYAPSAAAKHLEINLEVDPTPAWVLSNAIKFTPEAGHIALTLHTRGADVVLTVSDDGEGIETGMLQSIFEPFQHHDKKPTRRHGGLGIGLTIVRQLVKEHDGQIVAESAGPNRGSRFIITVPSLDADERDRGDTSAWMHASHSRNGRPLLDRVRVLLIEDDEPTRDAVAGMLRNNGAEVTITASAADARDALERTRPDIVVSDIGMPGEDGNTFIRKVRAREKKTADAHLPALALTIHDRDEALTAGFDRYLAKPFEAENLVLTIDALARAATTTLRD
jgi:PAS domain S-box-containing protein